MRHLVRDVSARSRAIGATHCLSRLRIRVCGRIPRGETSRMITCYRSGAHAGATALLGAPTRPASVATTGALASTG